MKMERKEIKGNIIQITLEDERWYAISENGEIKYIPSVTWICEYYPKGIGFFKWLASKGWDEAEAIKIAAGEKGNTVHNAVEMLLKRETISYNSEFINDDGIKREITADEYGAVLSFVDWWQDIKPEILGFNETVIAPDKSHAGTLDIRCKINNENWIIDIKTSADIWPSHELQVNAYRMCGFVNYKMGILQLGYKRNKKKKYKFTEILPQEDLFSATKKIWGKETEGIFPLQREYPIEIKLS